MWKCATKRIKSIFTSKNHCLHNNVATRQARSDKGLYYVSRLSPTLLGERGNVNRRSTRSNFNDCGQFSKGKKKEDPKTDKGWCLDGFSQDLADFVLRCSGIFVLGWLLLQPHRKAIFSSHSSDKCPFNLFSNYRKNKYVNQLYQFTKSQILPVGCVRLIVDAQQQEQDSQTPCNQTDGIAHAQTKDEPVFGDLEFKELEMAHNHVIGALNNINGAQCLENGQYSEAFCHFQEGALIQNPSSMYNLGICHEMGWGTDRDYKKAAEMYKKASDMGHPSAMYNLAVFYIQGLGDLKVDFDHARKLFQSAARLGQPNAQKALDMENSLSSRDSSCVSIAQSTGNAPSEQTKTMTQSQRTYGFLQSLFGLVEETKVEESRGGYDDSGALDLSPENHVLLT